MIESTNCSNENSLYFDVCSGLRLVKPMVYREISDYISISTVTEIFDVTRNCKRG
jgi:hypothetical protein